MGQNVTFSITLKVDGKDVVRKVSMDMEELRSHVFRADSVYYDLGTRNRTVLGEGA